MSVLVFYGYPIASLGFKVLWIRSVHDFLMIF